MSSPPTGRGINFLDETLDFGITFKAFYMKNRVNFLGAALSPGAPTPEPLTPCLLPPPVKFP